MLFKAAINGARPAALVPWSPRDAAESALGSVRAGAKALHLHPRDSSGAESLDATVVSQTLGAVRAACPGIPMGISSGSWIEPDVGARLTLMRQWRDVPDFISVNFDEDGAEEVADLMIQRGIGVEAGLNGAAAAERFACYRQNNRVLRILLEPQEQRLGEALENVASVESTLRALSLPHPFLLHGRDLMAWRLIEHAARNGYDTRAGLEDTRALPDGTLCRSNEELVAAARAVAEPCAP